MPAPYGLLSTGFNPATTDEVIEDMKQDFRDRLGASLPVDDTTIEGVIFSVVGERIGACWEATDAIAEAFDPDAASDTLLHALCAITGTIVEAAEPSTASLTLVGDVATTVTEGSTVSDSSTDTVWSIDADVTLVVATVWAISTAYVVGDIRSNSARTYRCITAGTSAGAGGPALGSADMTPAEELAASDITDNTAHWEFLGMGVATGTAAATCTVTGPTAAVAYAIDTIETPITGWGNVVNLEAAVAGQDDETDAALRVRRELELSGGGAGTPDAIREEILDVTGVTTCTVLYNDTDATVDTIPPHAVEVMVQGGATQDIVDAIFGSVAAGIATFGNTSGTATDSEGTDHTIYFTRPTEVPIYVDVVLVYDSAAGVYAGDAAVKTAIKADGDAISVIGKNAVASRVTRACFDVAGVIDVTDVDIDDAATPPDATTVQIGTRQVATWATANITVSSSSGTP